MHFIKIQRNDKVLCNKKRRHHTKEQREKMNEALNALQNTMEAEVEEGIANLIQ